MVPIPGEGCLIKRTLLVALIVGLASVGIAKPGRKTRSASKAKTHNSSKLQTRNGKKVQKKVVAYRVKPGDNDWTIAHRTGVTIKELRHINGGKKLGVIRAGQTLNIAKFVAVKPKSKKISVRSPRPARRKTAVASRPARTAPSRSSRRAYVAAAAKRSPVAPRSFAPKIVSAPESPPAPQPILIASLTPDEIVSAPVPKAVPAPTRGSVDGILQKANTFRGVRYSYGAMSRSATDCSGFTAQVFRANGYRIPRTSAEQSKVGQRVLRSDLAAGDLVFFRTVRGTRVSHVGIYVGGNRFIHASSGGHRVMVSALTGYYANRYVGARRVAKGNTIRKVVETAVEAEKTQQVPLDPEPRQSATDVIGN